MRQNIVVSFLWRW